MVLARYLGRAYVIGFDVGDGKAEEIGHVFFVRRPNVHGDKG